MVSDNWFRFLTVNFGLLEVHFFITNRLRFNRYNSWILIHNITGFFLCWSSPDSLSLISVSIDLYQFSTISFRLLPIHIVWYQFIPVYTGLFRSPPVYSIFERIPISIEFMLLLGYTDSFWFKSFDFAMFS